MSILGWLLNVIVMVFTLHLILHFALLWGASLASHPFPYDLDYSAEQAAYLRRSKLCFGAAVAGLLVACGEVHFLIGYDWPMVLNVAIFVFGDLLGLWRYMLGRNKRSKALAKIRFLDADVLSLTG